MRAKQKFCDLSVYLPTGLFDVLLLGAQRHGTAWHLAHAEIERRLRVSVMAEAERLITAYAAEGEDDGGSGRWEDAATLRTRDGDLHGGTPERAGCARHDGKDPRAVTKSADGDGLGVGSGLDDRAD
jgi:hypothetical protein